MGLHIRKILFLFGLFIVGAFSWNFTNMPFTPSKYDQSDTNPSKREVTPISLRTKRCIVVQKQSGTHGDSSEGSDAGQDYDYNFENKKDSKKRRKNKHMRKRLFTTTPSPWVYYGDDDNSFSSF